jgi:hypothetical protein
MNHEIFRRQIHMMNGDKLCMMSYKPLIKIRPGVLFNFPKINMLWAVGGYIKSSSTQMGLLTDTRHVLWLKAILKLFGVYYKGTFTPVAKMNTVRVLLSVVVNNRWLMC